MKRDAQLARTVLTSDDAVDKLRNTITKQMVELMKRDPVDVDYALRSKLQFNHLRHYLGLRCKTM